jgi:hypothetical protein
MLWILKVYRPWNGGKILLFLKIHSFSFDRCSSIILSKIAYWRLSLFWLSVLSPWPGVLCFVVMVGCGVKRDSGLLPVSRPLHPKGGREGMQKETKSSSNPTIRCFLFGREVSFWCCAFVDNIIAPSLLLAVGSAVFDWVEAIRLRRLQPLTATEDNYVLFLPTVAFAAVYVWVRSSLRVRVEHKNYCSLFLKAKNKNFKIYTWSVHFLFSEVMKDRSIWGWYQSNQDHEILTWYVYR